MKSVLAFLVFFILIIPVNLSAQAVRATAGSGLYKDRIYWINWDLNNNGLPGDAIANGTTRVWTSSAGVKYTVRISNVVGSPKSENFNSYGFSGFRFAYNGFSNRVISLNNGGDSNASSFRVTVSVLHPNGITTAPNGIVIAGTESLNSSEFYQLTTLGSNPLKILETYIYNNNFAAGAGWGGYNVNLTVSNSGKTIKATNDAGNDGRGDVILVAEKTSSVDVSLQGGGEQTIAIGIVEDIDYGDAPDSYEMNASNVQDNAMHNLLPSLTGGSITTNGTLNLSGTSAKAPNSNIATYVPYALRLGPTVDADENKFTSTDATGDDTQGIDDETAITNFSWSGCSLSLTTQNLSPATAYAHIWIDLNNNGIFEASEKKVISIPNHASGTVTQTVDLSSIGNFTAGDKYFVRARISHLATLDPYGYAQTGEVEDHLVTVTLPTLSPNPAIADCITNLAEIKFTDMPVSGYTINQTGTSTATYTGNTSTFTISNLGIGNYTFVVTNSNGCSYTYSVNVTSLCCTNSGITSVNLNSMYNGGTLPTDVVLEWWTSADRLAPGVKVTDPTAVTASGRYYVFFYDTVNNCYNTNLSTSFVDVTILPPCAPTVCFNDPKTGGTNNDTKVGITLLKRAGAENADNWPMVRKSGHIALESNTQGFVVTRMTTAQLTAIKDANNAVEGMMSYDTDAKCLKIYDGTDWKCFSTPSCP